MEVGEVSQTVQVEAEGPLLRSDSSDLGTVVARQQFLDLPIIGQGETRNPTSLMILVPGVTGRGTAYGGGGTFDARYLSTTVSGSQSGSTEWHLEGSIICEWRGFFCRSSRHRLPSGRHGRVQDDHGECSCRIRPFGRRHCQLYFEVWNQPGSRFRL